MEAMPLALVTLLLSGCYVTARGGPSSDHGTMLEVVVGAQVHLVGDEPGLSPIGRRIAFSEGVGYVGLPVEGKHHGGFLYEGAASVIVALRTDVDEGTLLRADLSGGVGWVGGFDGPGKPGGIATASGIVAVERYSKGWAFRAGVGAAVASVTVAEPTPMDQVNEGSHAPIAAFTFEFTPLIARLFERSIVD